MSRWANAEWKRALGRFTPGALMAIAALYVTLLLPSVSAAAWGKGLYYNGVGYELVYDVPAYGGLVMTSTRQDYWSWGNQPVWKNVGACVFNGLLYGFFTTSGGALQYVTVTPGSGSSGRTGPTTIATGVSARGAAAAVLGDAIYVFTADRVFRSKDGKQFTVWLSSSVPAQLIIDAVTFYPRDQSPAGIMVIFNDSGKNLAARRIHPPDQVWSGGTLPWPTPVDPNLPWLPVFQGNLVLGTSAALPGPGVKAPSVQFYGISQGNEVGEGYQGRWEYNLTADAWTVHNITAGDDVAAMIVTPWFDTIDATSGMMRLSHRVDFFYRGVSVNPSDWMVPQHKDPVYGWAGAPTVTATATGDTDDDKRLRALWSLVGIVLGPPPFALNGAQDAARPPLSQVQYGIDESTSVTTTVTASQTLSVASNNEIKAGFGQVNLDLSYAHGWTSRNGTTHTVDVSTFYAFGPQDETPPDQGLHGWAIFNAPTLLTQQYKLYAYDYNRSTGSGTYLGQDLYATSVGAVVPQTAYFTLANPADGAIPGLFQGFPVYPDSTNIPGWFRIRDWNSGGGDWTAIFGDRSSPAVGTLSLGTATTQKYTQTDTTMRSKGNTNSFSISAGASFDLFEGFSSGVTVGYDATFGTQTEIDSTITKSVSASLNMPIPLNKPGYVKSLTTQPYWLQAQTANAPWIPTGYSGNLPWLITWDVLQYSIVGGATAGTAVQPTSASGTIKASGGEYEVAGSLAWLDDSGMETPLALSADEFDAAKGAVVSLNGRAFAADGITGRWTRKGAVWSYRSATRLASRRPEALDVKLDFAKKTWSFRVKSARLAEIIPAGNPSVRIQLELQGEYAFTGWVEHEMSATWSYVDGEKAAWEPFGVHLIRGSHDTGAPRFSSLTLTGHFPENHQQFGDVEIRINGASVTIPLLGEPGFLKTLQRGSSMRYGAEGLSFEIQFSTGLWRAKIEGARVRSDMAPRDGALRVQVLVGGEVSSDQTVQVQDSHMLLSYDRR